jgi:hypothetical protein
LLVCQRRDFLQARLLALVGIVTVLVTAMVFGYFLMDNGRFILVPLLFVLAVATGVTDLTWRQLQLNRSNAARS